MNTWFNKLDIESIDNDNNSQEYIADITNRVYNNSH